MRIGNQLPTTGSLQVVTSRFPPVNWRIKKRRPFGGPPLFSCAPGSREHGKADYWKNGKNRFNSALSGRRPYSQISKASACFTFAAASSPYHSFNTFLNRSA